MVAVSAVGVVVLALTGRTFSSPVMSLFGYSWLAGFYGLVLLTCLHSSTGWIARICRVRALRWLGGISYGVYLFHQPISGLCHAALRGTDPGMTNLEGVATTSLALLVTLLVAGLSFRFIETPIINFGHRFTYDSPASSRQRLPVPAGQVDPLPARQ
jgi:peptidoglycan/LPS O-acetylase OafA/YrhL